MGKNESLEFLEDVVQDVQNHLHILQKYDKSTLNNYIVISRLPDIELFQPSLEAELAEKDLTDEDRANIAKAEEEEKARKEKEAQEKAEVERLEKERLQKEEEERIAAKKAEEERLEAERLAKEEEERLAKEEAERLAAEKAEAERLKQERLQKEEEERIAAEKAEKERLEAERLAKEEEERHQAAIEQAQLGEQISVINFDTLKNKKKPIVKKSVMMTGGVSAAIAQTNKEKEELEALRKEEDRKRALIRKAEEEKKAEERLSKAILIGNTKKPDPSLGKFEIGRSNDPQKPYSFVLKTETGKVVFETSQMKTKPNELTAVMFKDIMANGSFTFTKTSQGYCFKILDARQRVFCTSKTFKTTLEAQKAAALIKKYGLSANYIDDTTL